jgi:predicted XRE-type DNA-binding protein
MSNVAHGTTNVFEYLGYADAGKSQIKTRLALAVNDILKGRKLEQREIAEILGVP